MFYVYVLKSRKDEMLYIGFTQDLKSRFAAHNEGRVQSTQARVPFELLYYEACRHQTDALHRERYLKSTYGHRYLKNRLRNDPDFQLFHRGDPIKVRAHDDFVLTGVGVAIRGTDGTVLEQGAAGAGTDGAYSYTATQTLTAGQSVVIEVTATDRPGHKTTKTQARPT